MTKPKGLSPEEEEAWHQRKRAYLRRYREDHREELAAWRRRYYQEHREEHAARSRRRREEHREELREYDRRYYQEHREEQAAYRKRLRAAVLGHYGQVCACCGSTARLTIDHVNGDGAEHRAQLGNDGGWRFYLWLIRHGFPPGFQSLCFPCNQSKGIGQRCQLDHTKAA